MELELELELTLFSKPPRSIAIVVWDSLGLSVPGFGSLWVCRCLADSTGLDWTGLDLTRLDSTGLDLAGLDLTRLDLARREILPLLLSKKEISSFY